MADAGSHFIRFVILSFLLVSGHCSLVFPVSRRLSSTTAPLSRHRLSRRHGRSLFSVPDIPISGSMEFVREGYYTTEFPIGSNNQTYRFLVDTGSNAFWIVCNEKCSNAAACGEYQTESGFVPPMYFPKLSTTSVTLSKGDKCKRNLGVYMDGLCNFGQSYVDNAAVGGFLITDISQYTIASDDKANAVGKVNLTFGCTPAEGTPVDAVSGTIGFGPSSPVVSQLASAGHVSRTFSHCLAAGGGGIFAVGDVEEPMVMSKEPLVLDEGGVAPEYRLHLSEIAIGETTILVGRPARVDSSTVLGYLPGKIFEPLYEAVFKDHKMMNMRDIDGDTCFWHPSSIDEAFPNITLRFKSTSMVLSPHEYFYKYFWDDVWCMGWQVTNRLDRIGQIYIILGAFVMSNKLMVYDLDNQTVGWTHHDCDEPIMIRDGKGYTKVMPHLQSSSSRQHIQRFIFLLLLISLVFY